MRAPILGELLDPVSMFEAPTVSSSHYSPHQPYDGGRFSTKPLPAGLLVPEHL